MKDNEMLKPKTDFKIDFENYKLTTIKTNPSSTYRLIIFVNTFYINSFIKDLFELDVEK
jgi:hypothetical protein